MAPRTRRTGRRLVFRAWIMRNGRKLWARDYGYKAWPIWV